MPTAKYITYIHVDYDEPGELHIIILVSTGCDNMLMSLMA